MEERNSNFSIVNILNLKDSNVLPKTKRKCRNTGICTKEKCVTSIEKRLPPIYQPNPKNEEAWGVKALPVDWVPVSKPSQVIENLTKKRQVQHETIINQIKTQFETINLDIEVQIRLNSEMLKRDFTETKNEIEKHIESVNVQPATMLLLSKQDFETVTKNILKLHDKHKNKIETFYVFLQELEKLRADKFKEVLKTAYEDLHKISYELPYELQQYFEHEILYINQMLLSNLRCYADLQLHLNLQAENSNRLHLQNLDTVKGTWKEIKKRDALNKLNQKNLVEPDCQALMLQTEQGKTTSRLFNRKEQNMGEMWNYLSPLPIRTADVNEWTKFMQHTINGLDSCARKLISLYKMAIGQIFNGYFDELQLLAEQMCEMGLVETAEISALSLEVCKPAIETVTRQYSDELIILESLWESVITRLQEKLQITYVFLHDAGHLWDSNFQRLEEAQRIVLKDLKIVIQKNNKATQDQEITLNVALDTLRQAPTETKLNETLDEINVLLDVLKNTYNSHYAAEVKVVDKYKTLVEKEAQVLLSELNLFLNVHPKETDNSTRQNIRQSQCSTSSQTTTSGVDISNTVLTQQMKQCEYQVAAVQNWMFGLSEAIERYASTSQEEALQQACVWTSERIKKLAKRLEVKLAFHASRYSRIKIDVYDIRLAELQNHSERLARHKAGAEKEIEDIKQSYLQYEANYNGIIEDYQKKITNITIKTQLATKTNTIKAYISDINCSTKLCKEKLTSLSEQQEKQYDLTLYKIRQAAVEFSKQIVLFQDQGNFHYDEAKKMTKDLKTFEKTIKKKFNVVRKDIQKRERKIVQQVEFQETESLYTLSHSLEEFNFNDKASERIKILQADIRTEVYSVKLLNNDLKGRFKEIVAQRLINLGDLAHLEEFESKFSDIILRMLEVCNYLYQPEPVLNASRKELRALSSEKPQRQTSDVKFQQKPASGSGKAKAKNGNSMGVKLVDYAFLLFEIVPTEINSFMPKICYNLYKSLEIIQSEAKEFYGTHGAIVNEGKVQPSYDEFMAEVFAKYNFYHLQCEMLWLDQINEFMKILQALQTFICNYRNEFLVERHNIHIRNFLEKHEELVTKVTTIKSCSKQLLHHIHDKLKPLHGHVNNKHLLQELESEMAQAVEQIRSLDVNDLLQPYKEKQEEDIAQYNSELYEADDRLAVIYEESFTKLLNIPLIKQFEQKIVHMTALLSEEPPQYAEDEPVSDFDKLYYDKIRSMKIPSECEPTLTNIQNLQEGDVTSISSNMQPYEFLIKFNEEYMRCTSYVEDIEKTWYWDVDNYENMFKANIQKVLKLYTVKYDNPLPQ